ncbi:glycosyltransferase [Terrimonas sp. NA20]|uniref:Glycosyltransferase n=1 Tax=Terrimonas ginsenosidimutans TaxID=2908004 RepID=A0ABS9L0E0_9BACT|nr:glycosyltransferase [Terrimonas ginsenosidimutans]MCG2618081.1 glycosyltransferase [Terrimonas ginsenosidimutans]
MRLLHIVAGMDPRTGGVTQAVSMIIGGLSNNGINNEVVCLDHPEADFLSGYTFTIHALGPAKTAWRFSAKLKPWLLAHISNYDAIVVHGLWQYHVYAIYNAWRKIKYSRPKLYVMPHGMLDPYFQNASGRRLKAIRNSLFWLFFERSLVNNADGLFFTCETERVLASKSFKQYNARREEIVSLGIPEAIPFAGSMREALIAKCGGVDPTDCILYISRIDPKKGVDLLVDAYISLKTQTQIKLPKLVIAGPGLDSSFGKTILDKAAGNTDIIFTGMLNGDAKWGAFYLSSALILPSHQENFGFVVVEAMSCSKPVLITDQVNIWREIDKGNAGLVEEDNLAGILKLLSSFAALNQAAISSKGENALATFNKLFSLKSSTGLFLKALNK